MPSTTSENAKVLFAVVSSLLLACTAARGRLIYTYDFPGPGPGNGSAANQTNPQPSSATFSDFTRNGGLVGTGNSNVFGSTNWPTAGALDPTVFTAFTITANSGFALSLSQLTFDSLKNGANGPLNAEVDLFLNGSAASYASFAWTPQNAPMTSYTFNFGPLTSADNVTTATFKFFAWNANDSTNELQFANVSVYGSIDSVVPEIPAGWPVLLLVICALVEGHRRRLSRAD